MFTRSSPAVAATSGDLSQQLAEGGCPQRRRIAGENDAGLKGEEALPAEEIELLLQKRALSANS